MLLSKLSCTILIITVILLNKYECCRSVYSALSNIVRMMSLLYPKGYLEWLHCLRDQAPIFLGKDCGQVQFKIHICLHSDTIKDAHTGLDRKNIQIKYCAKVQLLCCYVLTHVSHWPVITGIPQGSVLETILLNIFINYFNQGLEGILSQFIDDKN